MSPAMLGILRPVADGHRRPVRSSTGRRGHDRCNPTTKESTVRTHLTALMGAAVLVVVAACSPPGTADGPTAASPEATGRSPSGGSQLTVQVASFDRTVGEDRRLLAGVLAPTGQGSRPLVGGQVNVQLFYLGPQSSPGASPQAAVTPEPVGSATGEFLSVPGKAPEKDLDQPTPAEGGAIGVYESSVDLPRPGRYGVAVTAEVPGAGTMTGTGTFQVSATHGVPAVGDTAPAVANPTAGSDQVPAVAVDSRAQNNDGQVPDPALHDTTVKAAVASGKPTVVVISTPVYCQSRFCGPITDTVGKLQDDYSDRANFVHLEVWRNFQETTLNAAAAEYIRTEAGGVTEPWTFLIGPDGTIQARWDNVLDADELRGMLDQL